MHPITPCLSRLGSNNSRLYDERRPVEPQYPAAKPSETDQPAKDRQEKEKFLLEHAPPG
jgi:hypothetical protein